MRHNTLAIAIVAGTVSLSTLAHAGVSGRGFSWEFVRYGPVNGPSPIPGDAWYTFDLFFNAGSSAARVNGFNMGFAANPGFDPNVILTDGVIFNHAFGGDAAPNPALIPAFPALAFDTYLAMGAQPISFVPGSTDLTGIVVDGVRELRGTWFTQPPIDIAAGDSLFVGRFTVDADATFLGGNGSTIEVGFDFGVQTFAVGNAIPTPGAFALMGLGGLVAARRRR